jgi:hypothetical protein
MGEIPSCVYSSLGSRCATSVPPAMPPAAVRTAAKAPPRAQATSRRRGRVHPNLGSWRVSTAVRAPHKQTAPAPVDCEAKRRRLAAAIVMLMDLSSPTNIVWAVPIRGVTPVAK